MDVVTSEIPGLFGLEEHAVGFNIDARKRFLKPGGRLIPSWLKKVIGIVPPMVKVE